MIRKSIKEAIREHFFLHPTARLRVREIERELKLPFPSVIRYCKELMQEGILRIVQVGEVSFYAADRANSRFLLEKKLFNIRQLHECGLVDGIVGELSSPPIILFGSYAKGEDTETSDIDLYIETVAKKDVTLAQFEKKLKRNIQIIRAQSLKKISNPHLANNIINGVVLNGTVEVFT